MIMAAYAGLAQTVVVYANDQPVKDAHVQFDCLPCDGYRAQIVLTDSLGKAKNPYNNVTQVYISYLGYKHILDTLQADESRKYQLKFEAIDINEVVVTAQYSVNSTEKAVHKIKVIDEKKIEALGAVTLEDVLTNETNVRISQDNVLGSSTSIQGLSGQNVKILIDGVPIIGRVGGNVDLSQINLNDIERIEIIEGPLSVEYGTNALAGTINLITKKKSNDKYRVGVNAFYESVGQKNVDGSFRFKYKKTNIGITGGQNIFDGWNSSDDFIILNSSTKADSSRFKEWKPKQQQFIKLGLNGDFNKVNYQFASDFFTEEIENKGYPRAPFQETAFDDYYNTNRWSNNLNLNSKVNKNGNLNMIFAYNYFKRQKNTYFTDLTTLQKTQTKNDSDQDTSLFDLFMARGVYSTSKDSAKFNYALGYDVNVETGKGQRIENRTKTIGDYAVFASSEYQASKLLVIRPGLRYSYNTSYQVPLTPSLNFKIHKNKWTVRGSYSSGFRAPSIKDLYFNFVDINHDITGNPDLTAETSHNFSVSGIRTILKKSKLFKLSGSAFYNDIKDLITLAISEGTSYSYFNLDRFKTIGTMAQLEGAINHFKFTLGATYTGRYNSLSDSLNVDAFSYSPEVRGNALYDFKRHNLRLSVFYKYSGKVLGYFIDEDENVQQSLLGDFNTLDITATKGFWHNKVKWTIGGKNLFNVKSIASQGETDTHSSSSTSIPMAWGASIFTSLKINLNDKTFKRKRVSK